MLSALGSRDLPAARQQARFEMQRHYLRSVCAVFLVLVWSTSGRADMKARDLLQACRQMETEGQFDGAKISVPDKAASGMCLGFFAAVVGVTLFHAADNSPILGICTPEHVSTYDLVRATEEFVAINPETISDRAIIVVLRAAKKAYPCVRNRKLSSSQ